jgi:hypothetical protein
MTDASDIASVASSADSSVYEPEYDWETVCVHSGEQQEGLAFRVLTVMPPPLEYLSQLHRDRQEISGRQVWTGSLTLAHTIVSMEEARRDLHGKR